MKKTLILALIAAAYLVASCGGVKTVYKDNKSSFAVTQTPKGKTVITGKIGWEDWKKNAGWIDYSASDYFPKNEDVERVKHYSLAEDATYMIFAASWCSDSESELPKIMKLLKKAEIPEDKYYLIGLDQNKKEPSGLADVYSIERVPTLVINSGKAELGRIVEYPKDSWEANIIKILKK